MTPDQLTFGIPSPPPWPDELWWYSRILVAYGVVLFVGLLWWAREERSLRLPLALAVLSVPAVWAAWDQLDPASVPVEWLVPMQEGTSREAAFHLYNRSFHAEAGYRCVLHWATENSFHGLRHAVALNAAFHAVATVGFAVLTWAACRSGWAVLVLTAVFAGNRLSVNAVLSETPAAYMTMVVVSTVPLALMLRPDRSLIARGIGVVGVALGALVLGGARYEMVLPGLGIVAVGLTWPLWNRWSESLQRIVRWPIGFVAHLRDPDEPIPRLTRWEQRSVMVGIVLVCFFWFTLPQIYDPYDGSYGRLAPAVKASAPFDDTVRYLPGLLANAMPLGALALLVAGLGRAILEPRWFGLLPVTLLVLFRTYMNVGHMDDPRSWEYYRYTPMMLSYLLILMPVGWLELKRWPRVLQGVLVAMLLPWPGMVANVRESGWLYTRNMQREVRGLAHTMEDHPDCVIVVPIDPDLSGGPPKDPWELILVGEPMLEPIWVSAVAEDIPALVDYVREDTDRPPVECVLAWTSLDCGQEGATCPDLGEGETVTEWEWENLPWSEFHVGPHHETVSVGARRLR